MKRAIWLTICSALALAHLTGCGAGVGQDIPSTPSPRHLPTPLLTQELPPPQPVISVVPPLNSATAAVEATAVAQRTATGRIAAVKEETALAGLAIGQRLQETWEAERAPTLTAYALTGEQSTSPRADLGKPYPFLLHTHCGVDWATDFDGSFWVAADQRYRPDSLGNPGQRGTMTLTGDNSARFDFEGGSILFVRHVGLKYVQPCV